MALEQVKKSFDSADLLEPSVFLKDSEDSSQNVSAVGTASSVARQSSVLDDHEHCSGVIQHHVKILHWNDGFLDMLKWQIHFFRDILPRFFNIFSLIDVEHAGIRSHLLPDLVIQRHLGLLLQVLE